MAPIMTADGSYRYDLYGKPLFFDALNHQLSATNYGVRDLFSGQRYVPELGLYDDRNRFMSPDLGRFLQPDPIGFKGDGSNLYRYCGNDWANRSDPMGLRWDTEMCPSIMPVSGGTRLPDPGQQLMPGDVAFTALTVTDSPGAENVEQHATADGAKQGQPAEGLSFGQETRVANDSRLQKIEQGIRTLESKAQTIAGKSPQYGSTAPAAAEALRSAYNDGRIQLGDPHRFTGPENPMTTDKGVVYYNAQSPLKNFTVPRVAHEGQHLLDRGRGPRFDRERQAYNLEYATGVIVGPYHSRLSDEQVRAKIRDYP